MADAEEKQTCSKVLKTSLDRFVEWIGCCSHVRLLSVPRWGQGEELGFLCFPCHGPLYQC